MQGVGDAIAEIADFCFGFFDFDHQPVLAGDLLQVDPLEATLGQSHAGIVQGKGLFGLILEHGATGKIDAHVRLAAKDLDKGHQAEQHQRAGEGKGDFSHRHKVEVRFRQQLEKGNLLDLLQTEQRIVDQAADKEYGKEVEDDAEGQGDGKTLDRAGAEQEEHQGGNQGGDLGVDDRPEGLGETALDPGACRFSQGEFVAHTLVDEYVGVDRHTDGENDTGNTGQGQGRAEHGQADEEEKNIEYQADVGDHAGKPVVEQHEEDHQGCTEQTGEHPLVDRILPKAGTNRQILNDINRCRQGTDTQDDGQVSGFVVGKTSRDLCAAAEDPLTDHWGRPNDLVKDDGQAVADIFFP